MKQLIAIAACLLTTGASFAQKTSPAAPKTQGTSATKSTAAAKGGKQLSAAGKSAIAGTFKDSRNQPIRGVKVFIYAPDSSIIASGFTDENGNYETNSTMPGKYNVKIVYPSYKTIQVIGVVIKSGLTPISFKSDAPPADSTIQYTELLPKPVEKKKKK